MTATIGKVSLMMTPKSIMDHRKRRKSLSDLNVVSKDQSPKIRIQTMGQGTRLTQKVHGLTLPI